jgi:preprotein translocase subunit SecE
MSEKGMHLLHKRGYLNDIGKFEFCEHCVFRKQRRVSFPLSTHAPKAFFIIFIMIFGVGLLILLLHVVII